MKFPVMMIMMMFGILLSVTSTSLANSLQTGGLGSLLSPREIDDIVSDVFSLRDGIINNEIDRLLEVYLARLPSRVELGDFGDPNGMMVYDCYLEGLRTTRRDGNARMKRVRRQKEFEAQFINENVNVVCKWEKFLLSGTVTISTDMVIILIKISTEFRDKSHPVLEALEVNRPDFKIDVQGLSIMNYLGSKAVDYFVDISDRDIDNAIYRAKRILSDVLANATVHLN